MIHCIGDSHSAVFSGEDKMQPIWPQRSNDITPYFKSYRIGAATAYQLINKLDIIDNIVNSVVNKNTDHIMFCSGEVDIRAHLLKQMVLQNKTGQEVVKMCVDRYMTVVKHYKKNGFKTIVWGPIASWHDTKQYTGGPSFGTNIERNELTKEFNKYLNKVCDFEGIQFVPIFDRMIDEDGLTKPEYLDDWEGSHIHLKQTAMPDILDEFNKKGLITL